jgi:acetyl esterase/lipase
MRKGEKVFVTVVLIIILFIILRGLIIVQNHGNGFANNDISYGQDAKQKFDFYSPAIPSDRLIVIIHGGAWVLGDKEMFAEHSKFFSKKGYSVVDMNYRLTPKWSYDSQLVDISLVLKKIAQNPERYNLKSNYKVVLIGHSAGAHLATMYGLKETEYGTPNIDYVVGLAGPYDLTNFQMSPKLRKLFDSFRGDFSESEVSPIKHIPFNDQTKFLLVGGGKDTLVLQNQMDSFAEKLDQKEVYVEKLFMPDRNHNTLENFIPANDQVAQKIISFIEGK